MPTVREIADSFEKIIPSRLKLEFDNVGFLAGRSSKEVRRVLVALDITARVISEAVDFGAELIVSHHPLILDPIKSVTDNSPAGRRLLELLENGIAAICLHTSFDSVTGGVNDALAAAVGAKSVGVVEITGEGPDGSPCGLGRVCELPEPLPLPVFLAQVRSALGVSGLRYADAGKPVRRLVVCSGAGGNQVYAAAAHGCDTYLAGEIKYYHWLDGREMGLNVVEADHFCTENVGVPVLRDMLLACFPELDVRISGTHAQTSLGF
jgi:dinuclear metal center YbgI/SA1388 family protein